MLSGTVTTPGTYPFTAEATDSSSPPIGHLGSFVISTYLTISPSTLPRGSLGVPYSLALQAGDGTPPYRWAVITGTLPAGMTLSSSGVISGVPTQSETSSFAVSATDSSNPPLTYKRTYFLVIPLEVSGSLPAPPLDKPYHAALSCRGGVPPYRWSLLSGHLPSGLSLLPSGIISGTATTAGTSTFEVQVNDSSNPALSGSKSYTLTVH